MDKIKRHIDDILIGAGLGLFAFGIWGLSGNIYLSLSIIGVIIFTIGIKVALKG